MNLLPGLVSVTLRKLSTQEIINLCVTAKLQGIEWGGDIHAPHGEIERAREIRQATTDAGLHVAAYGSYYRVAESEKAGLSFESVRDTASALGAPTIRVWAGTQDAADASDEYRAQVVADLLRIAPLASEAGLTISLEFHGGTLTATAKSTADLLSATPADQVHTYWQPAVGLPAPEAVAGLRELLPRVNNIHVFHWWPANVNRHPLAAGRDRWQQYFQAASADDKQRWALLEFVLNDDPAQVLEDARTLHELLAL
jgi:3-dehydroshikimate dehydratase